MFNLFRKGSNSNSEKDFKEIASKIFPVIKVAAKDNRTAGSEFKGGDQPVYKEIAGDLLCFYGIDKDSHFELLLKRHLPENIGIEQLDLYAHDNLLNFVIRQTEIHQTAFGGYGLSCGGDHEAALLTLPEVRQMIESKLGPSVVFAVPSKDLIVFVNGENPADVDGLKAMVREVHNDGERLLSKLLFTYRNEKIEVKE